MKFEFALEGAEAREFCERIVAELQRLYGLGENEALERVNAHWRGQRIGTPMDDVVFHEDETFWAKNIFNRGEIPKDELDG